MSKELDVVEAMIRGDEMAAVIMMADMTPEALHELMRVSLMTAGLARESILGAGRLLNSDVRRAYLITKEMET